MSTGKWTIFWKNLGIKTLKRSRAINDYKPSSDFSALRRKHVDDQAIQKVYKIAFKYDDKLFFNKLSRFFRKDTDTIKLWLKTNSSTDAFVKLFNIIHRSNFEKAKNRLGEIALIYKYYRKGEGRKYSIPYKKNGSINYDPKRLIYILNRLDKDSKYRNAGTTHLGKEKIICIEKQTPNTAPVYKFIRLAKYNRELRIAVSMDSSKEYNLAKVMIEKWLKIFIDTPEVKKSFKKWEQFLITGESRSFLLTGVTYFDHEFKLTVNPAYRRIQNPAVLPSYKNKIKSSAKKEELISQLKILYKNKSFAFPIFIQVLSYRTAGIIGAIKLIADAKRMNVMERNQLYKDFENDFGIPLNDFINYKDLDNKNVYKIFLEGSPQSTPIEVRSKLAMSIYQSLLTDGLLSNNSATEEQTKFCFNRDCVNYYRVIWNRINCETCGEVLLNGRTIVTQKIDENRIANYLKSFFKDGKVIKLLNKLLSRDIIVAKVEYGDDVAEVIPITSELKDYQIEILKFRFPNLIVVTSKDHVDEYERMGVKAVRLYEIVFSLKHESGKLLKALLSEMSIQHLNHARLLCKSASARIKDPTTYKSYNKLSKYLGAELFEADCSAMFNYIFGNSLWLGAKYRGKSVPDGFTAFPLLQSNEGCFIWDGKFGESRTLHMGNFKKNYNYIEAAKRNQSIRDNGGLKAFVFISNLKFPKTFIKKYQPLIKGSNIKVIFLSSIQLFKLTDHFRKNEKLILNNLKAKEIFINSMKELFYIVRRKEKVEIINDTLIDDLLTYNSKEYKKLKSGKQLTV